MGKNLATGIVRNSGFSPDTSAPRPETKLPVGRLFGVAAHGPSESAATAAADLKQSERMSLAKEGKALPDGSFPIRHVGDLKNARVRLHQASDKGAAKRLIKKRERDLGVNLGPMSGY